MAPATADPHAPLDRARAHDAGDRGAALTAPAPDDLQKADRARFQQRLTAVAHRDGRAPVQSRDVPTSQPTFTAPASGATVNGSAVALGVSSAAAVVRFSVDGSAWSRVVPVSSGSAQTTWDSFGLTGPQTVRALDCSTTSPADCASTSVTLVVTVDNGAVMLTKPSDNAQVGSSFVAQASSAGGVVGFVLDGDLVATAPAAPYQVTIDSSDLAVGPHDLQAVRCNADQSECLGGSSNVVTVVKVADLAPRLTSVAPSPFSPNRDRVKDTTTVKYRLNSSQSVRWSVLDRRGKVVRGPVSLGTRPSGNSSFVFNGKSKGGRSLASGSYVVVLDTSKAVSGGTITGHAERGVVVDVTAPRAANPRATPSTVYPVRDGYVDSTRLVARLSERVGSATVKVIGKGGRVVRTLAQRSSSRSVTFSWNGLTSSGKAAPAGTYRFQITVTDLAGNVGNSTLGKVTVSDRKLVKRTGQQVVTAEGSHYGLVIGSCSRIEKPARAEWPGSLSYLSNYAVCYDPTPSEEIAVTENQVTLPAATKYGSIRVDGYGGKTLENFNDVAVVLYLDRSNNLSDYGADLYPSTGWHRGQTVNGAGYVTGRKFRWWAGTTLGSYYDIKSFRVSYTYYVLS